MTTRRPSFICAAVLAGLTILSAARSLSAEERTQTDADVRAVITRSLPFIEEQGEWWIEEKKCITCHRIGLMTWSFTEAARRGFAVDAAKLDGWIDWTLTKSLSQNKQEGTIAGEKNLDGVAQLLMGREQNVSSPKRKESYALLVKLLVEGQADDGAWAPGGQLPRQKRPATETTEVSTIWNALALAGIDDPSSETRSVVQRASERLTLSESGKSAEWYATRLLFAATTDEPDGRNAWLKRLRSVQNDDGGWGWIAGESSDALATGLSLYALCQSGVATNDRAIQSARQFLVETQRDDGSWAVLGTKRTEKDSIEETSTYWGTAWATIGLLQTLPLK